MDNLRIEFEKGYFKDYEKNVLCANRCSIFAPMSFIESEDKEIVSYDCSGYSSLKKIENIKISTALNILEKIFLALSESGEYLILPERITLNEQTVFYNEIKKDVKIAYIPLPDSKSSPKNNLLTFVSELKEKTPEKMKGYFDTIKTNIDKIIIM